MVTTFEDSSNLATDRWPAAVPSATMVPMDFPSPQALRPLVQAYARVLSRSGSKLGRNPLVLPNGAYFPDVFAGDEASVQRLVDRMLAHAGMRDLMVRVQCIGPVPADGGCGGCGSGGCGGGSCGDGSQGGTERSDAEDMDRGKRKAGEHTECGGNCHCTSDEPKASGSNHHDGCSDGCGGEDCRCRNGGTCCKEDTEHGHDAKDGRGDGCSAKAGLSGQKLVRIERTAKEWTVRVLGAEVRHPVVLTCVLARAVGAVFLAELGEEKPLGVPLTMGAELAAAALGLGALLLQGSHIYQKGCHGPSIAQVTELGCLDLAVVVALFAAMHEHSLRPARRELEATQREGLSLAKDWVASNPELVRALASHPERVALGDFVVGETRPWLARIFGSKSKVSAASTTPVAEGTLEELEASLAAAPAPKRPRPTADPSMDEIRKLVDDALREP